jgi:hypothetical protein
VGIMLAEPSPVRAGWARALWRLLAAIGAGLALLVVHQLFAEPAGAAPADPPPALVPRAGAAPVDGVLDQAAPALEPVATALAPAAPALDPVAPVAEPVMAAVEPVVASVAPVVEPAVASVTPVVEPVVAAVEPAVASVTPVVGRVAPAVQPVANGIGAIAEPVGQAVGAVTEPLASGLGQTVNGVLAPVLPSSPAASPDLVPPAIRDLRPDPSGPGDRAATGALVGPLTFGVQPGAASTVAQLDAAGGPTSRPGPTPAPPAGPVGVAPSPVPAGASGGGGGSSGLVAVLASGLAGWHLARGGVLSDVEMRPPGRVHAPLSLPG